MATIVSTTETRGGDHTLVGDTGELGQESTGALLSESVDETADVEFDNATRVGSELSEELLRFENRAHDYEKECKIRCIFATIRSITQRD